MCLHLIQTNKKSNQTELQKNWNFLLSVFVIRYCCRNSKIYPCVHSVQFNNEISEKVPQQQSINIQLRIDDEQVCPQKQEI